MVRGGGCMTGSIQDRADRRLLAQRIDRICDAFEAAWRAGKPVRPEDFLGDSDGAEREALLAELVATERELRHNFAVAAAETIASSAVAVDPAQTWDASAPHASPLALCPLFSAVPQS